MTEQQNKAIAQITRQCLQAGMTLAGVAGVIANIEAESAFRSNNLQDVYNTILGLSDEAYTVAVDNGSYRNFAGDAAGYGYCQWTAADRKRDMLAFHRARGASIADAETQTAFMLSEMRGYTQAYDACMKSNNPYDCGYAVCKYYEIPADTENQARNRGIRAQQLFETVKAFSTGNGQAETELNDAAGPEQKLIPASEFWPPRMICNSMSGDDVAALQALLKARGYSVHVIDGHFAGWLEDLVKDFQEAYHLDVDGIVGPITWDALLRIDR